MKKTFLSFGLALVAAAPLAAQNVNSNINNSNAISTGVTGSTVSGIFGANNGGGGASAPSGAISTSISTTMATLSSGTTVSPLTGGSITAASAVQVSTLVSGNPQQQAAAAAAIAGELTAAGLGGAEAVALVKALAGLWNRPSPAAVVSALTAFNALIANAPASALTNPPPALVTVHAALFLLSAGIASPF